MAQSPASKPVGQDAVFFEKVKELVGRASLILEEAHSYAQGIKDPDLRRLAEAMVDTVNNEIDASDIEDDEMDDIFDDLATLHVRRTD
jgi:hypothetical protein